MPRTVRAGIWVVVGLLLGGSLASAKGRARKGKPAAPLVEVEGKLLEYEEKHFWCTYSPGAPIHGEGESPWGRFSLTGPANHAGRSFGVLLRCNGRPDLLQALQSGVGRVFVLVLPEDFLQGKYKEIEDCTIDSNAMKRWRAADTASEVRQIVATGLPNSALQSVGARLNIGGGVLTPPGDERGGLFELAPRVEALWGGDIAAGPGIEFRTVNFGSAELSAGATAAFTDGVAGTIATLSSG